MAHQSRYQTNKHTVVYYKPDTIVENSAGEMNEGKAPVTINGSVNLLEQLKAYEVWSF